MKQLLFIPLSLSLVVGCTTTDATDDADTTFAAAARIAEHHDSGAPDFAWYQAHNGLAFEAHRIIGTDNVWHRIDIEPAAAGPITFELGKHYSTSDLAMTLTRCGGAGTDDANPCLTAVAIDFWTEQQADGTVRYHYLGTLPGETSPSVEDTFTILPGNDVNDPGL